MAISKKILKFLEKNKAKYELISHKTVFTAFDKAKTLRVPEKIVGKTLVIKMNGGFALVLISAHQILDKVKFKKIVNDWRKKLEQKSVKEIGFATEAWMKKNLKGVKVGAIPPFGNLWTPTRPPPSRKRAPLLTFVDKSLLKNSKIIVNGGNYNSSIKINPVLFKKLIPDLIVGDFGKIKK